MDFSTDFDFFTVNILLTLLWDLYAVIISSMVVGDVDFSSPFINSNPNNNLRSENNDLSWEFKFVEFFPVGV